MLAWSSKAPTLNSYSKFWLIKFEIFDFDALILIRYHLLPNRDKEIEESEPWVE